MASSPEITWGNVQLSFFFLLLTYVLGLTLFVFPPKPFGFFFWGLLWFALMWFAFEDNIRFLYEPSTYNYTNSQFYDYWGVRAANIKLALTGGLGIVLVWFKPWWHRLVVLGFVGCYVLFWIIIALKALAGIFMKLGGV